MPNFNSKSIAPLLQTRVMGRSLQFLATTPSTQKLAVQAAKACPHGHCVVADCQSQGQGRGEHTWESPRGVNLYFSLVFKPDWPMTRFHEIQFLSALAALNTLKSDCGLPAQLKWPNDIYAGQKKLGGIILNNQPGIVVMGMGLNLNAQPLHFSPEVQPVATSVFIETGVAVDRWRFFAKLLQNIEDLYDQVLENGFELIRQTWERHCMHLNQRVKIYQAQLGPLGGQTREGVEGIVLGINAQGHLILQEDSGNQLTILDGTFQQ